MEDTEKTEFFLLYNSLPLCLIFLFLRPLIVKFNSNIPINIW